MGYSVSHQDRRPALASSVGVPQSAHLCNRGFQGRSDHSAPHGTVCDIPGTCSAVHSFPMARNQGFLQNPRVVTHTEYYGCFRATFAHSIRLLGDFFCDFFRGLRDPGSWRNLADHRFGRYIFITPARLEPSLRTGEEPRSKGARNELCQFSA
jgi:hypothetical protein